MGRGIRQSIATVGFTGIGWAGTVLGLAGTAMLAGCGMAAAPQPPSLHLPAPVKDLKAARAGNTVELSWTSPKETTDKLKLTGPVKLRICREQGKSKCQTVASTTGTPGKPASYTDHLTPDLSTGPLRPATYRIDGLNQHDRSAGHSNPAKVLMGSAPEAVVGLAASMTEHGVILRWQASPATPAGTQIMLHRTLLLPPKPGKQKTSAPSSAEPAEQTLTVSTGKKGQEPGVALDTGVQFDRTYRYTATRVETRQVDKQSLQAASSGSNPATITTRDTFPPAAPVGLVAVPVSAGINGGQPEIDLSWSPNAEPDLAQYRVYRRELPTQAGTAKVPTQRIAPQKEAEPLIAPAFRDMHVQPGRTYAYSVTAVDAAGNESAHSAEVQVVAPGA